MPQPPMGKVRILGTGVWTVDKMYVSFSEGNHWSDASYSFSDI